MECRRTGCYAHYSGHFGKSKKKKSTKLCSPGLTKHLKGSRTKAHLDNAEEEQAPQNNCYLWYKQEGLVDRNGELDYMIAATLYHGKEE